LFAAPNDVVAIWWGVSFGEQWWQVSQDLVHAAGSFCVGRHEVVLLKLGSDTRAGYWAPAHQAALNWTALEQLSCC